MIQRKEGTQTDIGQIRIRKEVLSAIVSLATKEVEGLCRMGGGVIDNVYKLLGRQREYRGINVEISGDSAKIDIAVIIKYGYNIHDVAVEIQERVRSDAMKMAGLASVEVNVDVRGIEVK
jgi:uncharacterized alkaline shock family protein YloU